MSLYSFSRTYKVFKLGDVANIRKVRIEVTYQDDSSTKVKCFEEMIERKIRHAKKS